MKLGTAAVIVAALAAPGAWGFNLGCSHEARPPAQPEVAPDERPPLPPASPIGFLVDTQELTLRDDQASKLRSIDEELAGQLATDNNDMRPEPVAPVPQKDKPRGLSLQGGGGAAGGPMGTSPGTSPGPATVGDNNANGDGTRQYVIPADVVGRVYRARAKHVREAVKRALAVLDPPQQQIALRVLTDHGVDPETGEVKTEDPGTKKLADPKLGQPLPREP